MHVSNHILQLYFVHIFFFFLTRLCWRFKQSEWEGGKKTALFCVFPFRSQRVGRCWRTFTLTLPHRWWACVSGRVLSPPARAWHHLPNYYCCCVYNFRGSRPLRSEPVLHYWAVVVVEEALSEEQYYVGERCAASICWAPDSHCLCNMCG